MRNGNGSSRAGLKIGRSLELARKERGLSLHQVEQETKIRARYLRELERENFDVLPPVYVQGSLKTYANFLGLDAETLTQELKRRQPLDEDPETPTHIEPPKNDYLDRNLVSHTGAETWEIPEDEESAGAATFSADNRRFYLAVAAFLVLAVLAVVLAPTLPRTGQPEVSRLREPLISQAPEASRAGNEGGERAPSFPQDGRQSSGDESDGPSPDQNAGSPKAGGEVGGRGAGLLAPSPALNPPAATNYRQSASPTASAPAEPETTPTPSPAASSPPVSAPAEAPIQDRATGVPIDGPVSQDDRVVMEQQGEFSVSSVDGDNVKISRGGGGIEIRASQHAANDNQ
jgi:transcriptional regulator with XRE-family HTH domain